ncbi:hypothetical protein D3C84_407140 [compost metagenome]
MDSKNLGRPLFWVRRNTIKSHATVRGLQLPICSLDPRWQQPIAVQQVLDDYGKSNEAGPASTKRRQLSGNHRFLNCVINAFKQVRLRRASWCGWLSCSADGEGEVLDDGLPYGAFTRADKYGAPTFCSHDQT